MLDFTIKFGQNYLHLHEIVSTNLYAADYITKTYPTEGTVIRADYQSGGRGQIGRGWYSSANLNLLCTTIIYPTFLSTQHQFLLSKLVSVSLTMLLERLGIEDVRIKWPNDIYVKDKKIAGILIQNQLMAKKIKSSIIGVGLNINQEFWPVDLPNPVSIKNITNRTYNVEDIMFEYLDILETNYKTLVFKGNDDLEDSYLKKLYLKGVEHTYYSNEKSFKAILKGVEDSGRLILESKDEILSFAFREISFRKS